MAKGLVKYQDAETGVWYQIVDQGKRDGNLPRVVGFQYVCLFFVQAINSRVYRQAVFPNARKAYDGILKQFIKVTDGQVSITNVCAVAGLGRKSVPRWFV